MERERNRGRVRCVDVPAFKITVHNEEFTSSDEHDCASQEEALKEAVKSAIAIASDQVSSGKPFFGAELTLAQDGKQLIRYILAVGALPLKNE